MGLESVVHLGDTTFTDYISVDEHLDFVESTLNLIDDVRRVGHGMLLAGRIERPGSVLQDATRNLPRIESVLQKIDARGITLETAPAPTIFSARRDDHRVYFWQRFAAGVNIVPVADEIFQHGMTLSQWLANLLVLAPRDVPGWQLLAALRLKGPFLREE
jgi:hypothetical protein